MNPKRAEHRETSVRHSDHIHNHYDEEAAATNPHREPANKQQQQKKRHTMNKYIVVVT